MAKPPKKPKPEDIETVPDAWQRFERAIDKVTQQRRPKHKPSDKKKSNTQSG